MHSAAYQWVAQHARRAVKVLDIGGRDINGSPRDLFPDASYTVVDLYPGRSVDVVADVTEWDTDETFDVVLCLEVFEHVEKWPQIIDAAYQLCSDLFIVTCAGPGRAPHSAADGGEVRDGEWYANVGPGELYLALKDFTSRKVNVRGSDVRAWATK